MELIIDPNLEGSIIEEYPYLKELNHTGDENVFRYLSLAYDPNSKLVKQFPDIKQRKAEALRLSGYDGYCDSLLAIRFVKGVIKRPLWTLITSIDNTFSEYADKVNSPIDMEEDDKALKAVELKNKMLTQMAEMLKTREALMIQLFDNDKELEDAEVGLKKLKPENIGKKMGRVNVPQDTR